MKTWVWITLIILVAVVMVILFFRQPAVLLIRKTFEQITGMEFVDGKEYHEMRALNTILEARIDTLQARDNVHVAKIEDLQRSLESKGQEIEKIEGYLADVKKEYDDMLATVSEMTTDEHVYLFDELTEGETDTYKTAGGVLTGEDRLKDANHKLLLSLRLSEENELYVQMFQAQKEKLRDYDQMVERLEMRNANLQTQMLTAIEQRDNCYAAHEDILESSERMRRLGITAGVVGLLIAIIF